MYKLTLIVGLFFLYSCNSSINQEDLQKLNGYWEIKEVVLKDGTKKEYSVNTTVDFIKVDSLSGFRKKVDPKFNGTFETSDDAEPFDVLLEKEGILIQYHTELASWTETLLSVSESSFSVKNQDGLIYKYERYEPININP
ncbi:MAG: hypothetical protein WBB24_14145 [Maribacter sp.]